MRASLAPRRPDGDVNLNENAHGSNTTFASKKQASGRLSREKLILRLCAHTAGMDNDEFRRWIDSDEAYCLAAAWYQRRSRKYASRASANLHLANPVSRGLIIEALFAVATARGGSEVELFRRCDFIVNGKEVEVKSAFRGPKSPSELSITIRRPQLQHARHFVVHAAELTAVNGELHQAWFCVPASEMRALIRRTHPVQYAGDQPIVVTLSEKTLAKFGKHRFDSLDDLVRVFPPK